MELFEVVAVITCTDLDTKPNDEIVELSNIEVISSN